jgi:GNAT superfamily N-acetyltransferase
MFRLTRHGDARSFLDAAEPILVAQEARHAVTLGLAYAEAKKPGFLEPPPYLATVADATGRVVAAAMRTPPRFALLAHPLDPVAVEWFVDDLSVDHADLTGADGSPEATRPFVEAWASRMGVRPRRAIAERAFELTRLVPHARPASGRACRPGPGDRALVAAWIRAFHVEAVPEDPMPDDLLPVADRWIAGGGPHDREVWLWEDGGVPVSMVASAWPTRTGIRVAPVYTPPEARGHGYASSLVAHVTRTRLDAGRERCFLFTDLANPTSNKIYQALGYEPRGDVDRWAFDPPTVG